MEDPRCSPPSPTHWPVGLCVRQEVEVNALSQLSQGDRTHLSIFFFLWEERNRTNIETISQKKCNVLIFKCWVWQWDIVFTRKKFLASAMLSASLVKFSTWKLDFLEFFHMPKGFMFSTRSTADHFNVVNRPVFSQGWLQVWCVCTCRTADTDVHVTEFSLKTAVVFFMG